MKARILAVFAAVLFISGCATIIDGTSQQVTFQSEPVGVEVFINGVSMGMTPVTVDVERMDQATVVFKKAGYKDQTLTMTTELNRTFWGNIIIGGLPGSTTDAVSGASREYTPGTYYVKMEAK